VFSLDEWKSYDSAFIEQQQKLMPEPERWNEMLVMYSRYFCPETPTLTIM